MGPRRGIRSKYVFGASYHARNNFSILGINSRPFRNFCESPYSFSNWSTRYGFWVFKYAFLLVFLFSDCCVAVVFICGNRSCLSWLDYLSAAICLASIYSWLWNRNDIMACQYCIICCWRLTWQFKLYCYYSKFKN